MNNVDKELLKKVRRIQIRSRKSVSDLLAGAYHSVFKGSGIEFEDVRHYEPGDDIRSIDWNVTARMQFPFIKRYREERERTVLLLVDVSASTLFGSSVQSKQNLIAELSALLAFSASTNNDKIGLVLFSDKVEQYIPPRKNTQHVLRLIREILSCNIKNKLTKLSAPLEFIGKVHKRQSIIFVLSDFISSPFEKALSTSAKRHDITAIKLHDHRDLEIPPSGIVLLQDLETGENLYLDSQLKQNREYIKKHMQSWNLKQQHLIRRAGVGYIPIYTDQDYTHLIYKYFKSREK